MHRNPDLEIYNQYNETSLAKCGKSMLLYIYLKMIALFKNYNYNRTSQKLKNRLAVNNEICIIHIKCK